ncbi:MAG: hypothetical protein ACTSVY_15895 [Candidatus Helarchaeota archaeon]
MKNGHDTSVKGRPQYFYCKDCNISFYAHTSASFQEVELQLQENLFRFFVNGKFNVDGLRVILNCSDATISKICELVINAVNGSRHLSEVWTSPKKAEAIHVDETFINIDRLRFYLIAVVNDQKEVLGWDLVKHRLKDNILPLLELVQVRIGKKIPVLVTDDFSVYKGVATALGHDLTHVRHVHKPPYGRVCMDLIRHEKTRVKTIHVATLNDIFEKENTFLVRVSESEKIKHEKGKRGRKKGGKNRPKKKIVAEKKAKKIPKKRGPKNPFKDAMTQVYHYYKDEGRVGVLGGSNPEIAANLEELLKVFKGKCITTNLIEQEFSSIKKLIDFRGNRSLSAWISTINFYFTVRADPTILSKILKGTRICPHVMHRLPLGGSLIPFLSKQLMSKNLKEEIYHV